eukprot:13008402-Alexandrium_andersonii.AAC.1
MKSAPAFAFQRNRMLPPLAAPPPLASQTCNVASVITMPPRQVATLEAVAALPIKVCLRCRAARPRPAPTTR